MAQLPMQHALHNFKVATSQHSRDPNKENLQKDVQFANCSSTLADYNHSAVQRMHPH